MNTQLKTLTIIVCAILGYQTIGYAIDTVTTHQPLCRAMYLNMHKHRARK